MLLLFSLLSVCLETKDVEMMGYQDRGNFGEGLSSAGLCHERETDPCVEPL